MDKDFFLTDDSSDESRDESGYIGSVEWDDQDFADGDDFPDSPDSIDGHEPLGSLGVVTICGRPNVGKSSLVNRIIGRREAVVEDRPGVTRDRITYEATWNGKNFTVEDTGGFEPQAQGVEFSVSKQAQLAMKNASIIVFVVDGTVGVTTTDESLARDLRRLKTPVILVANKVDSEKIAHQIGELWSLGLGEPYGVSATHGQGVADLLDEIILKLEKLPQASTPEELYRRVALVGKPNVGKSSLLNKLVGHERAVVSPLAGTTVDPVDSLINLDENTWKFIDTAGLKKKFHLSSGYEYYATLRTQSAIESAEVAIVLIDAGSPLSEQDLRILSLVSDAGRALVIAFNKWDCVDENRRYDLDKEIDRQLSRVSWARQLNISATTGRGLHRLEPALLEALQSWDQRIGTGQLNQWLKTVVSATPPPVRGGKLPRILYVTQAATRPPTFVLFTTGFLEAGYRRFLERKLRETFGFEGTPMRINMKIREKGSKPLS